MDDRRTQIMQAAMQGVRKYGLDGVRIQQIGEIAGVPASSIYTYFHTKDELMCACFVQIDRQIAAIFDQVTLTQQEIGTDPEGAVRKLWTPYYLWLISHPDETVFYHRYRDNPGFPEYDKTRDISYFASFVGCVTQFQEHYHIFSHVDPNIIWLHILTSTVLFAKYVVQGVLADTDQTRENIFRLLVRGVDGLFTENSTSSGAERTS